MEVAQMGHRPALVYRQLVSTSGHTEGARGEVRLHLCIQCVMLRTVSLEFWEHILFQLGVQCFPLLGFDTVFSLKHWDIRKEPGQVSSPFMLPPASSACKGRAKGLKGSPPLDAQSWPSRRNWARVEVKLPLLITEHPLLLACLFLAWRTKKREESQFSSLICSSWWPVQHLKSFVMWQLFIYFFNTSTSF